MGMAHWIDQERHWLQDQDHFRMQIDEVRKWDEWERRKERAAEPVEESPEDEVEREQR
jgi:hypothetical protein